MGNYKLQEFQTCDGVVRHVEVRVPSSSDPSTSYLISGVISGDLKCSCPGHNFKGSCKHLKLITEECGWDSFSELKQTAEQRVDHVCPKCGGKTVDRLG